MIQRISTTLLSSMLALMNWEAVHAAEAKLKAASFQGEEVVFARPFYRWVAEANRRCRGKVVFNVVGPNKIKPERQWFELREGRIDAYFGPSSFYRGALSEADVFHLAKNSAAEQRQNGAWAILNKLHSEKLNARYLTALITGIKFFIYTTKPVKNGRFDGMRLRAVPLYKIFIENLGAQTTYMPAPDIKVALEQGRIDGFGWPLWGLDHFGWEKLVRYKYGPGFMDTAAPILINLDRWKSLSREQRQCLNEMAVWAEKMDPIWRNEENEKQLAILKKAGIKSIDLGPEFSRGPEKIFWKMLKTANPNFVQKIRPLIE